MTLGLPAYTLKRPAGLWRNPLAFPAGRKPGFDPTHPAAAGCRFSGIATANGFISLLNAAIGVQTGASTFSIDGALGPSVTTATSSYLTVTLPGTFAAATQGTMAAIYRPTSSTDSWAFNSVGGLNGVGYSSTAFQVLIGNGSTTGSIVAVSGAPYFVVASWINASTLLFVVTNLSNGEIATQTTTTTRTNGSADTGITIGNRTSGSRNVSGLAAVAYTNVFLSLTQLLAWAADPWSFWYPDTPQFDYKGGVKKNVAQPILGTV